MAMSTLQAASIEDLEKLAQGAGPGVQGARGKHLLRPRCGSRGPCEDHVYRVLEGPGDDRVPERDPHNQGCAKKRGPLFAGPLETAPYRKLG